MKAILLAAGVGKRLRPFTDRFPKCLIEIGGKSLLLRSLDLLVAAGIAEAVVIVGHRKEAILERFGKRHGPLGIHYVENPDYRRGSILSLWAARSHFDDDLLIMDADVLFPGVFLSRLIQSPHPSAVLLDERSKSAGEERMHLVQQDRVVDSTKNPKPPYDRIGEGVGFLKLAKSEIPALIRVLEKFVPKFPDIEYEETFQELFKSVKVGYESVGDFSWTEIDFPEDVERAEKEVLPRIEALGVS